MRVYTPILLLMCISLNAVAQTRKYSNEFLAIGVGARGLAMSKAQVASVDDVTSAYWNPAGLAAMGNDLQVAGQHAEYFAGIAKYDYAAVAVRSDDRTALAFSFIRFGVDDIPNTIDLIDANGRVNYDRITTFSAADYAFIGSFARKTSIEGLRLGGNAKVIYRQVGNMAKAWGFGLDVGAQYDLGKWRVGAVGRDITSTFNAWSYTLDSTTIAVFNSTGNTIPQNDLEITLPRMTLGIGRKFMIKNKVGIMPEINADITIDGKRNVLIPGRPFSVDPGLGLELSYQKIFYIRGGIGNVQRNKALIGNYYEHTFQPNIGVGVVLKDFLSVDYALTDIGDRSVALYSNVFSLRIAINKKSG